MFIKSNLVRAALVISAIKTKKYPGLLDVLHVTDKYIESANAVACVRMEHGATIHNNLDVTLRFNTPLPDNAQYTQFTVEGILKVTHFDEYKNVIGESDVTAIDCGYCNIDKLIPKQRSDKTPIVAPELLALPYILFGDVAVAVRLLPSSESTAIRFEFDEYVKEEYGNPLLLVMPRSTCVFDTIKEGVEKDRKEKMQ